MLKPKGASLWDQQTEDSEAICSCRQVLSVSAESEGYSLPSSFPNLPPIPLLLRATASLLGLLLLLLTLNGNLTESRTR